MASPVNGHTQLPRTRISNHTVITTCLTGYPWRPYLLKNIGLAVDTVVVFMQKVNVETTYQGDPFLVTVADYDGDFAGDPAYDNYGIVYNDRSQVRCNKTQPRR